MSRLKFLFGNLPTLFVTAFVLSLTACGGGSGGSSNSGGSDTNTLVEVSGGGVEGPLAGAIVRLYSVDLAQTDLKGTLLGEGSTGNDAAITGLSIDPGLTGLVLLEFSADAGTFDINTGLAPVIAPLTTVFDVQRIYDGDALYATPLTTMVVTLAQANADNGAPYAGNGDDTISSDEFTAALTVAQNQVKSTLGFGLDSDIDIFSVPPLITADTVSADQQAAVAAYRQAVEALVAFVMQVAGSGSGGTPPTAQELFDALIEDLEDGLIDGANDGTPVTVLADLTTPIATQVTDLDPNTLLIPGTTTPVTDIIQVLNNEMATTGEETDTTPLAGVTVTPEPLELIADSDGNGVDDSHIGGAIHGTALSLTGTVSTLSGDPDLYGNSDGAPSAPLASFYSPSSMTFVGDDAYVVDVMNSTIRKISANSLQVTTFAGQVRVFASVDGIGTDASFFVPGAITNDGTYLYVTEVYGNRIRRIDIATAEVDTLAGDGTTATVDSSNGYGDTASFLQPSALVYDSGYLYVVEKNGKVIRKVDVTTGETTTLAGDGTIGSSDSTDHTGATAQFRYPNGITSDGSYLYVADSGNNTIRRVDRVTGETTTFAGSGAWGVDDGTGTSATFELPTGIATDGTYLYVAAGGPAAETSCIRRIEIATAVVTTPIDNLQGSDFVAIHDNALYEEKLNWGITRIDMSSWTAETFAGNNATGSDDGPIQIASYSAPSGITTDGSALYMTDIVSGVIRKIDLTTSLATTVAGQANVTGADDGNGTDATFYRPTDITTDGNHLFVADTNNNAIRQIDPATGEVTTLAGGSGGYLDDTGTAAQFRYPTGVTTDGSYLYVADSLNARIRRIDIATGVVDTFAGSGDFSTTDGTGTAAAFYKPDAITTDGTYLYVTESLGCVVRRIEIASRAVTTFAGDGTCTDVDGTGTGASFKMSNGTGLTTDGTTLYVGSGAGVRSVRLSDAEVTTLTTESPSAYGITTDGISLFATANGYSVVHKIE